MFHSITTSFITMNEFIYLWIKIKIINSCINLLIEPTTN
jgi:hypothetical protein